jgi:hypothetical protein
MLQLPNITLAAFIRPLPKLGTHVVEIDCVQKYKYHTRSGVLGSQNPDLLAVGTATKGTRLR